MKSLFDIKKEYIGNKMNKRDYIHRMHKLHQILFDYSEFIKTTDIKGIQITDGKVIMEFRNSAKFVCDPVDERISPIETINFTNYEGNYFKFFILLAKGCKSLADIGANIGWYSINTAKIIPKIKVYSFEPIRKTYGYLSENIKINNLTNVFGQNIGLSNFIGNTHLYYYDTGSGNASLKNLAGKRKYKKVLCHFSTLDNIVNKKNIKIDLIKCDVEGNELNVFKGAQQVLRLQQPIIFTEMLRKWTKVFHYHPNDIIELLKEYHYQCFYLNVDKLISINTITDSTIDTNFIFLNKHKHTLIISKYT